MKRLKYYILDNQKSMHVTIFVIITLMLMFYTLASAEVQPVLAAEDGGSSDSYPHITDLENAILGQSFPGQPVTERLGRMEKKAFGKVSTNPDLSDRTDALDDYSDKQLHKKLRLDADEETTNSSGDQNLGERTDALDRYAQKKLHKQTLQQPAGSDTAMDNPSQGGGLLSKVEHAIVGMAAGGIGGGPGMIGGPGSGFGGMGFPGMGNGFSGVGGGGGMRRRQSAQQQQDQTPSPPIHQEDPAVYQVAPPDPNTKLIVKVGWCEVKIFGHTFPNMHLPERLGQLNKELNLEPGKSDIQLMDDIGLMIKAVEARKQSAPIKQTQANTSR